MKYAEAVLWKLRTLPVCREAAKQFIKQNPDLPKVLPREALRRIGERGAALESYVRLTYKADKIKTQIVRDAFTDRIWAYIRTGR